MNYRREEGKHLLVTDDAREHAASRLRRASTRGRLNDAELEERVERVYAARTRGELATVSHDLPRTQRGRSSLRLSFAGSPGRGAGATRPARIRAGFELLVSAVIALPILPSRHAGPAIAANGDLAETIGWPDFTRAVAAVYRATGRSAVIFTANYREAGAIDRYGPALGLPGAYIANAAGVDNDERGRLIYRCTGTRGPWSRNWHALRHLG